MKLKYSIDKVHPIRDLTPHEKVFLQGLAEYKLFLDKSLFFQIDDLQKHTELVLSGEKETAYRYEFPDPDELKKEIEELEKMIKELEDMLNTGKLPQEYWVLLEEYRKRLKKLKEALDKMKKGSSSTKIFKVSLLGKYEHKNGDNSRVTLYVNNIEACAKNSYDTMLLMGQVLLHEYFHSFYYHVGVGSKERIKCVEEPMAEFGSLVFLDSVASSESPVAIYADHSLKYALGFVKKKQKCEGITAAYGFGAYIFDKHKEDFPYLIAEYANVSRLLDKSDEKVLEYKYLVYPCYPFKLEEIAYEKLLTLLEGKPSKGKVSSVSKVLPSLPTTVVSARKAVSEKKFNRFVLGVFKYLERMGLIGALCPYITSLSKKTALKALAHTGYFQLRKVFLDYSFIPPKPELWWPDVFVIYGKKYRLSNNNWSEGSTHNHFDDFAKMIKFVYGDWFDIKNEDDGFVLIDYLP